VAWNWFKKRKTQPEPGAFQLPPIRWLEPANNPWGVRVLDVRTVTLSWIATSADPLCARNAASYGSDDGTGFIGASPASPVVSSAQIRYRADGMLADGVLFVPSVMEHKWAIYFHRKHIIFVRSWLRQVFVVADTQGDADEVIITSLQGTFTGKDEPPSFTARVADYLLRSHALNLVYPAPLLSGIEADPQKAALWCFSLFGNKAQYATPHELPMAVPDKPLRTRLD
jgi:hypothetical protein